MANTTTELFQEFASRGYEPLLATVKGIARFDLVDGDRIDHVMVAIDKGDVRVSYENGKAECTVRAERPFFERVMRGEANALAAVLRGELSCTGDIELLLAIGRVLPGPPADAQRVDAKDRRSTP